MSQEMIRRAALEVARDTGCSLRTALRAVMYAEAKIRRREEEINARRKEFPFRRIVERLRSIGGL